MRLRNSASLYSLSFVLLFYLYIVLSVSGCINIYDGSKRSQNPEFAGYSYSFWFITVWSI